MKQRDTNITVVDKRNSIKSAKVFPLALIDNKKAKMHSEGNKKMDMDGKILTAIVQVAFTELKF